MTSTLRPVLAQVGLVLGGFATLLAVPPADGPMWLVPVTDAGRAAVMRLAIANDARLIARGPLDGSVVVTGSLSRLWRGMLGNGVLVLAAPPAGCFGASGTGA